MPVQNTPHEEFIDENTRMSDQTENEEEEIAGCSFSIYPLSRDYINIIRTALDNVDMSNVWHKTDDVNTVIRGKISPVFDVSKATFLQAAQTGEHVTLRATYSIGDDPKDHTYDVKNRGDEHKSLSSEISRPVSVKFALYPLGAEGNYTEIINNQIEAIKEQDIEVHPEHYETRLNGDASDIFQGLEKVFRNTAMSGSIHTVMTVTMVAHNIEDR